MKLTNLLSVERHVLIRHYTGVFDDIRDVFAQTNEAKIRGYQKDALALMLKVGVVKLVKVMALLKLKCTFTDVCSMRSL